MDRQTAVYFYFSAISTHLIKWSLMYLTVFEIVIFVKHFSRTLKNVKIFIQLWFSKVLKSNKKRFVNFSGSLKAKRNFLLSWYYSIYSAKKLMSSHRPFFHFILLISNNLAKIEICNLYFVSLCTTWKILPNKAIIA